MTVADRFKEELMVLSRAKAIEQIDPSKLDAAFPSSMTAEQIKAVIEARAAEKADRKGDLSFVRPFLDALNRAVAAEKKDQTMKMVAFAAVAGVVLLLVLRK